MTGTVLRVNFRKTAGSNVPSSTAVPTAPISAIMHVISQADGDTLRALWRRFSSDAEQLMAYMERIGIGSPHSREFQKAVLMIKADLLAARVLRDQSKS